MAKLAAAIAILALSLALMAGAPAVPSLAELRSGDGWDSSLEAYGSDVCYRTADIAGLRLVELGGYESLLGFYMKVDSSDGPTAFADSFGVTPDSFEASFDPLAVGTPEGASE